VPIALIIPALDEELAIGSLVDSIDRSVIRDVIAGDNGSARIGERGYGAVCAGALRRLAAEVDVVVFMDADGSDDPEEIAQLEARIAEVPVTYRKRIGKSKISGTVMGVLKAGWWILYTIFRYARR
jgi:hypothetical protein